MHSSQISKFGNQPHSTKNVLKECFPMYINNDPNWGVFDVYLDHFLPHKRL